MSKNEQSIEGQKGLISRWLVEQKMVMGEWLELEISSQKSTDKRRIDELLCKLKEGDVVVASELSRLGRSIKEVLGIIESIIEEKDCRLVLVKQNIDINPDNKGDITNKVLVTIFSMIAELERDFVSERTKEGLRAVKARGVKLGKPKGTIQKSMYDKDCEKIFHLYGLGVPIKTIIRTHLDYGKYMSLKKYIEKRFKSRSAANL